MSIPLQLISKVLQDTTHYIEAKRNGLASATFTTIEDQVTWALLEEYYIRHGTVPPFEYLHRQVPSLTFVDPGKLRASELVEALRNSNIDVSLRKALLEVEQLLTKGKYPDAMDRLRKGLSEASLNTSRVDDVKGSTHADTVIQAYMSLKEGGFMRGIPWPWRPMNDSTGGMLNGEYIGIYGLSKSRKSFRMLEVAEAAQRSKKRVLFVTCELTEQVCLNRFAAIRAKINYKRFKQGALTSDEELRLADAVNNLKESDRNSEIEFTRLVGTRNGRTFSALRAKVDEFDPHIVFVDSFYKMFDERTGKADALPPTIRNISADLQVLAQTAKIPVVVSTQTNQKGFKIKSTTEDMGFAQSLVQDSDVLLRIYNDILLKRTIFLVKAAREVEIDGFSTGNSLCDGLGPVKGADGLDDWALPSAYRFDHEGSPREQAEKSTGGLDGRFGVEQNESRD